MGVFGASVKEEEQLRKAAGLNELDIRRQSAFSGPLSDYETADDGTTTIPGVESAQVSHDLDTVDQHDHTDTDQLEQHDVEFKSAENSLIGSSNSLNEKNKPTGATEEENQTSLGDVKLPSEIRVEDLDWDNAQDPANPANWAPWKRWFITTVVAFVCLSCSLGSSLFVSGSEQMMVKFNASQELVISGLTFYILGLAFGPILASPISELYGRRYIYIFSVPIGMLFTMGVGLSTHIYQVLILRFFAGYFCSPALSIAGASVTDIWASSPADISFAVALFCLAPFLGPVIGPIIGGFSAEYKNWQWAASWVSLMFSGLTLPFVLILPETYKPTILAARAKKRGIKVIRPPITEKYVKDTLKFVLFNPIKILISEPIVFFMSVYTAFIFAVLFGFFEAFPIIFRGVYKMDEGVSGLPFIGVGLGLIFGIVFYVVLDKVYFFPKNPDGTRGNFDENGNIIWDAPEKKLLIGKIGAFCLPISLFWMGWTSKSSIHWMSPTASGFPFGFGLVLVFLSVVLYFALSFTPKSVASALAANNLLRYVTASVFPLFTVQMYKRLDIGWASSLFAFISLALVPVPFVFERYGPKFRANSKYGYAAYFQELAAKKAAAQAATEPQGEVSENLPSVNVNEEVSSNKV